MRHLAVIAGLAALWGGGAGNASPVREQTMIPATVDGESVKLATIIYRPDGAGPFPTAIFHHGSTGRGNDPSRFSRLQDPTALAEWLVARGWVVVAPSRRGRGGSEGLYDEGFAEDRSRGYTCDEGRTVAGADRALRDVEAASEAILALPFVDRTRLLVGGYSRGGILSVAWPGRSSIKPRAIVNFVGGWLAADCPTALNVNRSLMNRGAAYGEPSLWLYGDRDPYYPLSHTKAVFEAFRSAGGKGEYHDYVPVDGTSGHNIILSPQLWDMTLRTYLYGQGLPFRTP